MKSHSFKHDRASQNRLQPRNWQEEHPETASRQSNEINADLLTELRSSKVDGTNNRRSQMPSYIVQDSGGVTPFVHRLNQPRSEFQMEEPTIDAKGNVDLVNGQLQAFVIDP